MLADLLGTGDALFDVTRNSIPSLCATSCASRIIWAATSREGGYRQMSCPAARRSRLLAIVVVWLRCPPRPGSTWALCSEILGKSFFLFHLSLLCVNEWGNSNATTGGYWITADTNRMRFWATAVPESCQTASVKAAVPFPE